MEQFVRSLPLDGRDLVVSVHTKKDPTREEWETLLVALKEAEARKAGDLSRVLTLILGDGGSPDTLMRDALSRLLKGRPLKMAVVTDSVVARGAVTAIGWFNPQVRAFATSKGASVFEYLGMSDDEVRRTNELLQAMVRIIDVGTLETFLKAAQEDKQAQSR